MPNKMRVKVEAIYRDEQDSTAARAGENLRLRISGRLRRELSAWVADATVHYGLLLLSGLSNLYTYTYTNRPCAACCQSRWLYFLGSSHSN